MWSLWKRKVDFELELANAGIIKCIRSPELQENLQKQSSEYVSVPCVCIVKSWAEQDRLCFPKRETYALSVRNILKNRNRKKYFGIRGYRNFSGPSMPKMLVCQNFPSSSYCFPTVLPRKALRPHIQALRRLAKTAHRTLSGVQ